MSCIYITFILYGLYAGYVVSPNDAVDLESPLFGILHLDLNDLKYYRVLSSKFLFFVIAEIGCVIPRAPSFLRINFIPGIEYPVGEKLNATCSNGVSRRFALTCEGSNNWHPQIRRRLCEL